MIALYGVGVFIAAAVMGLATVIEPWLAAVIVGVKAPAAVLAVTAAGAGAGALIYKQRSADETETAATPTAV